MISNEGRGRGKGVSPHKNEGRKKKNPCVQALCPKGVIMGGWLQDGCQ